MTTRIDQPPLPTPAPAQTRQAENTDTRQAIQRHDPEFHRKKKGEDEESGFKDPYEDLTDVSVPALRNFLAGLLDRMGVPAPAVQSNDGSAHSEVRAPASPKAAAAMNAYQTRAGTLPAPTPPPAPAAQAPTALDQAAAGLDRATVLELIRELDRLSAKGVLSITLEKGEGFLGSIRAGIDRALAGI